MTSSLILYVFSQHLLISLSSCSCPQVVCMNMFFWGGKKMPSHLFSRPYVRLADVFPKASGGEKNSAVCERGMLNWASEPEMDHSIISLLRITSGTHTHTEKAVYSQMSVCGCVCVCLFHLVLLLQSLGWVYFLVFFVSKMSNIYNYVRTFRTLAETIASRTFIL